MKYLLSLILFYFSFSLCKSQSFVNLKGSIKTINDTPLSGVIISLYKDSSSSLNKFAISNNLGEFKINQIIPYKNYVIKFSLIGYEDTVVYLKADDIGVNEIQVSIVMKVGANKLKDVLVQANRKIIENGDTTTFNAKDFGSEKEAKLEDLLKNLPGMQVDDNGNIKFKGKPINKVLIEGDDLFGRNYKLMTQSLGAYTLSKVEAIENDAENPLLKDFFGFKQTNLNIKLKKDFLFKIFGDVTAKVGIDPRYVIEANTYSIAGKNKFSVVANANNSGIDTRSKVDVNSINPFSNLENAEDRITSINPIFNDFVVTTRPPLLSKELNLLNNDYLFNGNYLRKLNSNLDLRTNIIAVKSDNYFNQNRQTTFINTLTPTLVNESLLGDKSLKNLTMENRLSYFDKKKWRIIYSNQISFKNENSLFSIIIPLDTILPNSLTQKNVLSNVVNLTYKASKSTTIEFNIDQQYIATNQNNINNTSDSGFKKIIGVQQNESFFYNSNDYFNSFSFKSAIYFKELLLKNSRLNLSLKARVKNIYESYTNDLSYYDTLNIIQIGSNAFNLQNRYKYFQRVLGPKILLESNKWNIRFEPQLISESIHQELVYINSLNKNNYFYLNPNVFLKYKLNGFSSIELSFVEASRTINYQDIFGGSRFGDYRTILSSSLSSQNIPLIRERKFSIVYSNFRISKGTIFQSNIFYAKSSNPILSDYLYSSLYNTENKIIGINPYDNYSFLLFFEKAITKIKSYFSFNNFSSLNLAQSRNSFTIIQQKSYFVQNDLSIRTNWTEQFVTKFTYGLITNVQLIKNNDEQFVSNLSKLRTELTFSSKSKKVLFKAASEHYWFNGMLNGMPFVSANLNYQLKKNKILLSISGNNLLNNTQFKFFNGAAANSNQQSTVLQQRLIQVGMNIKF